MTLNFAGGSFSKDTGKTSRKETMNLDNFKSISNLKSFANLNLTSNRGSRKASIFLKKESAQNSITLNHTKSGLESLNSIHNLGGFDQKSQATQKNIPITNKVTKNRVYLQLTFLTVDEYSDNVAVSIIGYCFFPLFNTISDDVECKKSSEKNFYLMKGHYQIPVYKDGFQNTNDDIEMPLIEEYFERIPACTALIRIYESSTSKVGSQRNLIRGRGIEKTKVYILYLSILT
jgi:hypothetical protein